MNTQGFLRSYVIGFVLSIIFTLAAYIPVSIHLNSSRTVFSQEMLISLVLFFALAQLFVQLFFFLHLSQEKKPRWNLIFFLSTASIILIIVLASLWIMQNLNYNIMPDSNMNMYIQNTEAIRK
jgi:cytochrome o ubiquinol oxidase operon protein cyoD